MTHLMIFQRLTKEYKKLRSRKRLPLKILQQKEKFLIEATTEWTTCWRIRPSCSEPITRSAVQKTRKAMWGRMSHRLLQIFLTSSARRFHRQRPPRLPAPLTICLSPPATLPSPQPANLRRSASAKPSSWLARRDLRKRQPVSRLNWHSKFCTNRQCVFVSFSETVWHLNSSAFNQQVFILTFKFNAESLELGTALIQNNIQEFDLKDK